VRGALLLSGFSGPDLAAYDRILRLEAEMEKAGGLTLL
jgi:hypothetical protein